ncbi:hypothetical protein ACFYNZ_28890 [Streptomyces kebangsaanensis]|uniref:Uncharacterized protein n=1 Tax=Streptomyces kebangsaanensis TaxID=864058 RepID=A0ABW6KZZ1_9ACTN
MATRATPHRLTGCATGEVLGVVVGAAAGPRNAATAPVSPTLAFAVTVPVNRWMIGRGRGHAVVHAYR